MQEKQRKFQEHGLGKYVSVSKFIYSLGKKKEEEECDKYIIHNESGDNESGDDTNQFEEHELQKYVSLFKFIYLGK